MFSEMFFNALTLIGGLAFFLYGMHVMGDGLTKLSGGRLERILERLTHNRMKAVLLGAGVTAVIQSSSATTVTVVGFVNSGIMKLEQAIGVIMGANIGTTVTSWLLSLTGIEGGNFFLTLLKPSSFTPVLAIIGIFLIMSSKQEKRKDIGAILIGFSVLMFGMDTMSAAVEPLADVPEFTGIFTMFSNPFLGMLVGALLTAIIQSSSASVGILQALCATGSVPFATAIPIIMGQNIGTCVTALLSSVGAGKNAKRAALVHLYFNVIGTAVFMIIFYTLNAFLDFTFMHNPANAAGIAVIHSLFNIGATLLLLPFAKGLEKLAMLSIKEGDDEKITEFARLDVRFLDTPALALEQCRRSANEMAYLTLENMTTAMESITEFSQEKKEKVEETEAKIDRYEEEIGEYLRQIANRNVIAQDNVEWNLLVYCIRDFERISDHACNIVEEAAKIAKSKAEWPRKIRDEMTTYSAEVHNIVSNTVSAFIKEDIQMALSVEQMETHIDQINKRVKKHNLKRAKKEKCSPEVGIFINELSINFERVADHCENIALSLLGEQETETGGMAE
ncbi:MAG: Na/Pi cotransporter family protein [Eubacterium sp.]|nr:Na/Pi cotransporter family protein [Eubacterium sp.]